MTYFWNLSESRVGEKYKVADRQQVEEIKIVDTKSVFQEFQIQSTLERIVQLGESTG